MAGGYHLFSSGEVLTAANVDNFLMNQTVMVFASAAARTSAIGGVLTEGMVTYRTDSHVTEYYNGSTWVPFIASTNILGRNAIMNADFFINQRAFTSNTTTGSYNFDRWLQQNSGGTCTVTPQTFTPGTAPIGGTYEARNFVQLITAGQAGAGDYAMLTQRIEDVTKYAGQAITISFYAKAGTGTPSVGVEVQQNFGTGGSPSATVSTPIAAKAITTSWAQYSVTVTVPSITGKTLGTTANTSYLELNFWISSGATNATRASSIGIQNATFSIWGVKLESGSSVTPFCLAHDSIGDELAGCQRYYWRHTASIGNSFVGTGWCATTTVAYISRANPVPMRVAPTIETDATAGHYSLYNGNTSTACSAVPALFGSDTSAVALTYTVASGLTAGQGAGGAITTIGAYLGFIAEL